MPIYEFYCPEKHTVYSFFARSHALRDAIPRCPDGEGLTLQKKISSFAVTKRREETEQEGDEQDPFADLDDAAMERVMAEMEGDLSVLDEENPDPQVMGRMMEKLFSASGKKMPPVMEEMLSRLKAGEDPDTLEEQYGDDLEAMDWGAGGPKSLRQIAARLREPRRDPVMYEMAEWLD